MEARTTLEKVYAPQEIEKRIYEKWEKGGYFTAEKVEGKKPFTIVMPPPNITGQLHIGHALDEMPQDVLTRYHRMKGDPTLWLPGTDHASIATEVKIVDALKAEGLTKQDIGREEFLKRAWEWKKQYGGRIDTQLRKLGVSCDWSRERFTMDDGLNRAVKEVFVRLYDKKLIYRGNRIINWCPVCKTALSDAEVEYEEQKSHLWHIRYPGPDGKDIVVATTRPETMLGDTAVCVNPNDERYTDMVGKYVTLPIVNKQIPIVADDYAELEFGTGAVKMTPAHDPNDFEVAMRHNLPVIRVLNDDGTMNENAGKFEGMTREACREAVVNELKELGLLVKIEPLTHNVGTCYRCHQSVEPLVSTQWFVSMKPLIEPVIEAVHNGELKFVPERYEKVFLNWCENIRDWCISRQLWWGHRIPAYYCEDCGEMVVSRDEVTLCPKCGGKMKPDDDVLDTWFSSALWPFSTLGWPENTEDFEYFYPNTVMSMGYDIIFFWGVRMVFSGLAHTGKLPFNTMLFHGLVRDAQGRKMSKSLGNGIDPIEVIDKYGADALRFSLEMGVAPGSDIRMSEEKIESYRNFCNKIWNAARFVLMNMENWEPKGLPPVERLNAADKWILTEYQNTVRTVTKNLDEFDLGIAATKLYDFIWSYYCDWYIEMAKQTLNGDDAQAADDTREVLYHVLLGTMKMLHPYMPFITEEIYSHLPATEDMIIVSSWPETDTKYDFVKETAEMEDIMEVVRTIRNLRAEMNVAPGRRARLILRASEERSAGLKAAEPYFRRLAFASGIEMLDAAAPAPGKSASAVTSCCDIYIPLGDLVDIPKEIARLEKDRKNAEGEIARAESKLANQGFVAKAPAQLIENEKTKLETAKNMLVSIDGRISELKEML